MSGVSSNLREKWDEEVQALGIMSCKFLVEREKSKHDSSFGTKGCAYRKKIGNPKGRQDILITYR